MDVKSSLGFVFVVLLLGFNCRANALPANRRRQEKTAIFAEINEEGPWIGLITVYELEEKAFFSYGLLKPHPKYPYLDISGRRFRFGTVADRKVIYVRCGMGMLNAGVVTQTLADLFNVVGILHFGIAGSANDSLSIGDVTVPRTVAHTGMWEWLQSPESQDGENSFADLVVADYGVPHGVAENLLGKISYKASEFYSQTGRANQPDYFLWVNVTSDWFLLAERLQGLELSSCVNATTCLSRPAGMAIGLRACSADVMVNNCAYRDFLFKQFGVSSVDEESAAVVMTCVSNNLKVMVFRGLSDLAGSDEAQNSINVYGTLAASNAVKAVIEFIKILPTFDEQWLQLSYSFHWPVMA